NHLKADGDTRFTVEAGAVSTAIVSVQLPLADAERMSRGSHKIELEVRSEDDRALTVTEKAAFFLPR
ncbi:MAG: hypothetical protein RLZZ290_940, partial [Pseudomonadota bacterium]